jgi:hypothetical protein
MEDKNEATKHGDKQDKRPETLKLASKEKRPETPKLALKEQIPEVSTTKSSDKQFPSTTSKPRDNSEKRLEVPKLTSTEKQSPSLASKYEKIPDLKPKQPPLLTSKHGDKLEKDLKSNKSDLEEPPKSKDKRPSPTSKSTEDQPPTKLKSKHPMEDRQKSKDKLPSSTSKPTSNAELVKAAHVMSTKSIDNLFEDSQMDWEPSPSTIKPKDKVSEAISKHSLSAKLVDTKDRHRDKHHESKKFEDKHRGDKSHKDKVPDKLHGTNSRIPSTVPPKPTSSPIKSNGSHLTVPHVNEKPKRLVFGHLDSITPKPSLLSSISVVSIPYSFQLIQIFAFGPNSFVGCQFHGLVGFQKTSKVPVCFNSTC